MSIVERGSSIATNLRSTDRSQKIARRIYTVVEYKKNSCRRYRAIAMIENHIP